MNNPESIKIINRFYEAVDMLVASNVLRGVKTFTTAYDINRRNFQAVRKNPESDMFQMAWLSYLVKDFGVSAQWLMTGVGGMFGRREYPFSINESKPKVSIDEVGALIGKRAEITYLPAERERKRVGVLKSVKYNKEPVLELDADNGKEYLIPLYTVLSIEGIENE